MHSWICQDCKQPIHWSLANTLWYHDSPADTLNCPGLGMVGPYITVKAV